MLRYLDLFKFTSTKRLLFKPNRLDFRSIQARPLSMVICSFMTALTSRNVIQSLRNARIHLKIDLGRCFVLGKPDARYRGSAELAMFVSLQSVGCSTQVWHLTV
jgi:hypothetical protein